jgi:hypothetical protein
MAMAALPRQKLVPDHVAIASETVRQIQRSVRNMKAGKVGGPVDIEAARRLLR